MQLSPQATFPIVYVLSDPNDTATYYVRSVMRNSATGAIIKINGANFVNLTDGGSRRFTAKIQAPNDPSGLGFWIDITTTVYTDSGYTTKSDGYAEQLDKYQVLQQWTPALGFGGGGVSKSSDAFDYEKLKALLIALFQENQSDNESVNLDPILKRLENHYNLLGDIKTAIADIEIPEQNEINLEAFQANVVNELKAAVSTIKKSMPKLDLSPVLDGINAIEFPEYPDHSENFSELQRDIQGVKETIISATAKPEPVIDPKEAMTARVNRLQHVPRIIDHKRIKALL